MANLSQTIQEEQPLYDLDRLIGSIEGDEPGPEVVVVAGMHGNEPSGVEALQNVFNILDAAGGPFRGSITGLRGNIPALEQEERFIDEDMNRMWFPSIIEEVRSQPIEELSSSERIEMKCLLEAIEKVVPEEPEQPVIIADIHSFSAEGWMFAITADKKEHTELISKLHVPMVFGIEDTLRGTALRYYQEQGYISFVLEGGQHKNDLTVYNETAALLLMLHNLGCISEGVAMQAKAFEKHLKKLSSNLPERVELVYQHIVKEGDRFRMRPGYKNFQAIKKGEWLAEDREGRIEARCDGYLLMPLYQDKGNDGFFMVREQA